VTPDWGAIESEHRGLAVDSARVIGEGWTSHAWLVNEELVFRFPKRDDDWKTLRTEIAFLRSAADDLPLAVPRYTHVAQQSRAAAHGYAVYRYVPGSAMDVSALNERQRATAAEAIATFLRSLHGLQPRADVAALLPREDPRVVAEHYFARTTREIAPTLEPCEAARLVEQFETYLSTPENVSFQPVVLHADFSREHIVMDDSVVSGVIDFEDVNWGDPDYDFMYLFVDFGHAFVEDAARRYGHPNVEQLRDKLHYFALVDQIQTILDGSGRALEGQEDDAWRRLKRLLRQA